MRNLSTYPLRQIRIPLAGVMFLLSGWQRDQREGGGASRKKQCGGGQTWFHSRNQPSVDMKLWEHWVRVAIPSLTWDGHIMLIHFTWLRKAGTKQCRIQCPARDGDPESHLQGKAISWHPHSQLPTPSRWSPRSGSPISRRRQPARRPHPLTHPRSARCSSAGWDTRWTFSFAASSSHDSGSGDRGKRGRRLRRLAPFCISFEVHWVLPAAEVPSNGWLKRRALLFRPLSLAFVSCRAGRREDSREKSSSSRPPPTVVLAAHYCWFGIACTSSPRAGPRFPCYVSFSRDCSLPLVSWSLRLGSGNCWKELDLNSAGAGRRRRGAEAERCVSGNNSRWKCCCNVACFGWSCSDCLLSDVGGIRVI